MAETGEGSPLSRRNRFVRLAGLALLAACNRGPVASTLNPEVTAISSGVPAEITPTLAGEGLPAEPTATPGLFPDYSQVFSPEQASWVAVAPSGDTAASWNSQEHAWSYQFETIAKDERINIFDANSFPDKFRDIAKNWLTATDEEWEMYQEFVEASRAEFFEKEGITEEVAAITDINPNLQSLWGMIYWVQHNRDRVVAEHIMPVVTPRELRTILEDEPMFESWVEKQETSKGPKWFAYGFHGLAQGDANSPYSYSSQNYGPILGREDFKAPRNPSSAIAGGDLALLAQLFPDDPNTLVTIISMKTPPDGSFSQTHALYAQALVLEEDYVLPTGTMCEAARIGEIYHPQPLPVDYHIRPFGTVEDFFNFLGANLDYKHGDLNIDGNGLNVTACLHPETGLEVLFGFANYTINTGRPPVYWPWPQQ